MRMLLRTAALLGLLLTGCLVPTIDDFNQEEARRCDTNNPCLTGYVCVEGHCQPEQGTACRPGTSAPCGPDTGECQPGTRPCGTEGTYGACEGAVSSVDEVCNGKDDDCDGTPDEGLSCDNACEECTAKGRTCVNGQCGGCLDSHYENGTECIPKMELGKACTENRMCGSGFCVDGVCCNVSACNSSPGQCFAATGTCSSGTCQYTPLPTTANCDDGNACTINDKCDGSGKCAAGSPRTCNTPPGQCYASTGTCSGLTGACEYAFLPSTTTCNDGNPCTVDDRCNGSGGCGGTPKVCNTPDQCQQSTGTCNLTTGNCEYPSQPSGTFCNDGSGCTGYDQCDGSGSCVGSYLCCGNQYCNGTQCVCSNPPCQVCQVE
ncbi:hypothetical protein JRI60_24295 [Archangium violaceum]|uniref:hypothetical protein n=1 Tax=Archangium violaceum TaxID=83451 RepID=UPI00194F25B3|nr:hypothetical protein [Archangium violaceum]QRO01913.1 hypothetical protein JRI60_24295 [Archangium violaceum]